LSDQDFLCDQSWRNFLKRHLPLKRPILTLSRPVHADFLISTLDCLTNFLKLTLSRLVHANFFWHLTLWQISLCQTRSRRPQRHSSFVISSFIRNSDQSFGIRTNRSGFVPIDRNSTNQIAKIRTIQFVLSSFVVRRSFVVFGHQTFEHFFSPALPTRTSTSEQQSSSTDSTVFPLAEHWTSYYCDFICLRKTLTSFTVEPFKIYFEDLMWLFTHLWRLDEQDSRLKISLSWHFTSSLKPPTVELNIFNKHFVCCY
jgi:hypothetical protein